MEQATHNKIVSFIWGIADGQEINPEIYAVCKADMLLKGEGEGENAKHIVGGAAWSILGHDAFAQAFDFILANPPCNDSDWRSELLRDDRRRAHGTPPAGNGFSNAISVHHRQAA